MALSEHVSIARRFQRSIRIDADLGKQEALDGFICPQSSAEVLVSMARHVAEAGQGAFTWTGPYGSGKSSLAIILGALLSAKFQQVERARAAVGEAVADGVRKALPPRSKGWRVLPVVGRRDAPATVIGGVLARQGWGLESDAAEWSEARVLDALRAVAAERPRSFGGLLVFVDEMGKFLEHAAHDGSDIYLFQQIAELASRSDGRLIFIGILHQSFEEYAHRLSREMRDEWSKIQGRFVDLAVNTAGEEQIDLLARAIETDRSSTRARELSAQVAAAIKAHRPAVSDTLGKTLAQCWPLHPVVAALLGPISRRRFGQNQRSLFGFLNSAEPFGFQEFLKGAGEDALYGPERLWDYLKVNLEPAILASPDGHRWALAAEALDRCEAIGGDEVHLRLLKSIALIDLFKERSGLMASVELLEACADDVSAKRIRRALEQLTAWSFILYRKHRGAYAIYAGSDFDIEQALERAMEESYEVDFTALTALSGLQPMLAKRHYHETGALRWFDVALLPVAALKEHVATFAPPDGTIGQFLLAIPTEGESEEVAQDLCREAVRSSGAWDSVVGLSKRSWLIIQLARELQAMEKVRRDSPELAGDEVARREVRARLGAIQGQLESELKRAFEDALWYQKRRSVQKLAQSALNGLASDLADRRFPQAPHLHNELLARIKPSANAVAAQKALLRAMVGKEGRPRLDIEGFPAEGGLFASLIEAPGLYRKTTRGWCFVPPDVGSDPCRLQPLWDAATAYLEEHAGRTVTIAEIYDLWRRPPFGLRDGLMPVLMVAFILSNRAKVALYRQSIFQAQFTDLEVDYLAKDPRDIQLRWMDLSDLSRRLLSGMADVVRELDAANALADLEPIDVARGLMAIFDGLPPWTKRTMRLSRNALDVRQLFKQANDPNQFLFDDMPALFSDGQDPSSPSAIESAITHVRDGLKELVAAYPDMLRRLKDLLLAELQVPTDSPQALAELRERAENIKQLAGDFRLDAFAGRLERFDVGREAIEGIASLTANKPPRDWVDPDLDRAALEMADMSQRFIRAEAFAHVQGRKDKRHALAVVVGKGGRPAPFRQEFHVVDSERAAIDALKKHLVAAIKPHAHTDPRVALAALAELSAEIIEDTSARADTDEEEAKAAS